MPRINSPSTSLTNKQPARGVTVTVCIRDLHCGRSAGGADWQNTARHPVFGTVAASSNGDGNRPAREKCSHRQACRRWVQAYVHLRCRPPTQQSHRVDHKPEDPNPSGVGFGVPVGHSGSVVGHRASAARHNDAETGTNVPHRLSDRGCSDHTRHFDSPTRRNRPKHPFSTTDDASMVASPVQTLAA